MQCDGIFAAQRQHWCPQHREEYTQRYSAYKRVSMQAEVLAIIFDEVEYMAVEACYDVKKIGAAARLVEQYVVRLDEAIRGREEHHQMFFAESACVPISRCVLLVDCVRQEILAIMLT